MSDHIYKSEYKRLLRYGRSLGCKISIKNANGKSVPWSGDFWSDEGTSHIQIVIKRKYSWIDRMLILGHELGHHFDLVLYKRVENTKVENAYAMYVELTDKKKKVPKWCEDLVTSLEIRANEYRRQIFNDLKLNIPVLSVIVDEAEDKAQTDHLFSEGKWLTEVEVRKFKAGVRKAQGGKYKGKTFKNWNSRELEGIE